MAIFRRLTSQDIFMALQMKRKKVFGLEEIAVWSPWFFLLRKTCRECRCLPDFRLLRLGDRKARRNLTENINWLSLASFKVLCILNKFNEQVEGKGEKVNFLICIFYINTARRDRLEEISTLESWLWHRIIKSRTLLFADFLQLILFLSILLTIKFQAIIKKFFVLVYLWKPKWAGPFL